MKKAVFFDIDGTLWDQRMVIPDSTKEAIRLLRESGTYTFLSSGRAPAFITNPHLLSLGFDGILAACGTCVQLGDQEIVYETIPVDQMEETLEILDRYNIPVVLEGKEYQYIEETDFSGDPFLTMLQNELGDRLLGIKDNHRKWEVCKFSVSIKDTANFQDALDELSKWYDFLVHGTIVAEGVPKGYSKASGIEAACKYLGIPHENTYAFGDSVNDLEMLRYVAHGIAMGNGQEEAKAAADYVTASLHEDGIYKGCKHFGLI